MLKAQHQTQITKTRVPDLMGAYSYGPGGPAIRQQACVSVCTSPGPACDVIRVLLTYNCRRNTAAVHATFPRPLLYIQYSTHNLLQIEVAQINPL